MPDFGQFMQWFFLLACLLPIIVFIALAAFIYFFGKGWIEEYITPDVPDLSARLDKIRENNPSWGDDKVIEKVVQEQALKCGIVGAITGLGGFATLIFMLPIDLLVTARYQASMVAFIAQVYGYKDSAENKAATFAVITGTNQVSKMTTAVVEKYLPRIFTGFFSKFVPILGAGISFAANYFMTRSTATLAKKWYTSKTRQEILTRFS